VCQRDGFKLTNITRVNATFLWRRPYGGDGSVTVSTGGKGLMAITAAAQMRRVGREEG
jgi:hypothetical protein